MNQNCKFMPKLVPLILSGTKTTTIRKLTPYRAKCGVGDKLHAFEADGYFFKKENHFADLYIIGYFDFSYTTLKNLDPMTYNWEQIALNDGFKTVDEFVSYFASRPDLKENDRLRLYQWDKITRFYWKRNRLSIERALIQEDLDRYL